jgi:ABC-type phosphate transport system substrate-binding protein
MSTSSPFVKPAASGLLLAIALLAGQAVQAEVVVIVSAKNATITLSNYQAADIFLGKAATFPGGLKAVPVDQTEGSPTREEFYLKTVGKAAPQMTAYWSKMIFTGQGRPPAELGDNVAIKKQVAGNPNAIGYIDRSMLDASVRAVLTLH